VLSWLHMLRVEAGYQIGDKRYHSTVGAEHTIRITN
jgi:hypothetical protein